MLTDDRLTMLKATYSYKPNIVGSLGMNMIGTDENQKSFWSDYKNNDSVYGSVKYKF